MNWESIARAGYEKYRETMIAIYQGQTVAGYWEHLQEPERRSWVEAAKKICDIQTRVVLA
jgi:hypothetical protein